MPRPGFDEAHVPVGDTDHVFATWPGAPEAVDGEHRALVEVLDEFLGRTATR